MILPSRSPYPLPLIPELLEHLQGACWFSKVAYNLFCVHQGNKWKTALDCTYGHFEYCVIPFGLGNAPATFQGFVNNVFCDLLGNYVIAHLHDILVYSRMWEERCSCLRGSLPPLVSLPLCKAGEVCLPPTAYSLPRLLNCPQGCEHGHEKN